MPQAAAPGIWAFASGSQSPGDQVGFARAGFPPGAAMLRLEKNGRWTWLCGPTRGAPLSCWQTLIRVAEELGSPVFVDSGAFSEFLPGAPTIPSRLWDQVLEAQAELAERIGDKLLVVLPDKVGSQAVTLRRLERHQDAIGRILDAGAHGVVVMHRGPKDTVDFAQAVADVLGREDFVLGFPTVRAGPTPEEIHQALRDLPWWPAGVHLLGLGPRSAQWGDFAEALRELPPGTWLSADAVMTRGLVGRETGLKPLTAQQDVARAELSEEAWGAVWDPLVGEMVDPTEQIPDPSSFLTKQEATQIARGLRDAGYISREEADLFILDPSSGREAILARDDPAAEFWLDYALEEVWRKRVPVLSQKMRKERAIRGHFGERPLAPLPLPRTAQLELPI